MSDTANQQASGTQLGGSFMGYSFNVKGTHAIVIFVLVVLVVLIVYGAINLAKDVTSSLDQQGVQRITNAIDSQTATQTREHNEILRGIQQHNERADTRIETLERGMVAVKDAIDEQNYIILQDNDDRRKIKEKLKMPASLRDKLTEGPRPRRGD